MHGAVGESGREARRAGREHASGGDVAAGRACRPDSPTAPCAALVRNKGTRWGWVWGVGGRGETSVRNGHPPAGRPAAAAAAAAPPGAGGGGGAGTCGCWVRNDGPREVQLTGQPGIGTSSWGGGEGGGGGGGGPGRVHEGAVVEEPAQLEEVEGALQAVAVVEKVLGVQARRRHLHHQVCGAQCGARAAATRR